MEYLRNHRSGKKNEVIKNSLKNKSSKEIEEREENKHGPPQKN